MVKYTTAILLFAVAVFWPSVSARSVHGHYQEPHHGVSVENDEVIEGYLRWAFGVADEIPISAERDAVSNILHETKHRHWKSFDEFGTYLKAALREYKEELKEKYSRNKRSVESDSEESTDGEITADQFAKIFVLGLLIEVAPDEYESALEKKFAELVEKEYDNDEEFFADTARVFKEVTGDDVDKYEDQINAQLKSLEEIFTED